MAAVEVQSEPTRSYYYKPIRDLLLYGALPVVLMAAVFARPLIPLSHQRLREHRICRHALTASVNGPLTLHSGLEAVGPLKVDGPATVHGSLAVDGELRVHGPIAARRIERTQRDPQAPQPGEPKVVNGPLDVHGAMTVKGNLEVDGPLTVHGDITAVSINNEGPVTER